MARSARFDPPVHFHKTAFLQGLQEAVGNGYVHYAIGDVAVARALGLVLKFAERYRVDADKRERYTRKAAGLANARLFLYAAEDPARVNFALLVTPGQNLAHELERLADARTTPLAFQEFELVRLTGRGRDKPSLTWRWVSDAVTAWRERLHAHTANYDAAGLYQDFYSLYRAPGFAGVRRQVGELVAAWRRDWERCRGESPCPVCYPHDEFSRRRIPGVTKREDGRYWTTKGFPTVRQLPTLFYVRKYLSPTQPLSRFARATEDAFQSRH